MPDEDIHYTWVNGDVLCYWLGDRARTQRPTKTSDREAVTCEDCIASLDMED